MSQHVIIYATTDVTSDIATDVTADVTTDSITEVITHHMDVAGNCDCFWPVPVKLMKCLRYLQSLFVLCPNSLFAEIH